VKIQRQTAINDVDAQYAMPYRREEHEFDMDRRRQLGGHRCRANFVRAKVVSITGGSGLTVQILG
jgi:hypothetical protein